MINKETKTVVQSMGTNLQSSVMPLWNKNIWGESDSKVYYKDLVRLMQLNNTMI